jgi:hypothetical protein
MDSENMRKQQPSGELIENVLRELRSMWLEGDRELASQFQRILANPVYRRLRQQRLRESSGGTRKGIGDGRDLV